MSRICFGLNPYGLTYYLGLQGAGGPRVNPKGVGLKGYLDLADSLGAKAVEIFNPWLAALGAAELKAVADELRAKGVTPIISSGLPMGSFDDAMRSARALGATVIRFGLTNVLCGDRALLGERWPALVKSVRDALADFGPRAAEEGKVLAIENHQDFGSDELADFCETIPGVGITIDLGNTFPVAEAPLAFVRRVARHVRHVHLKDYRAQFTDEGYRLVRCAIGDGATPIRAMLDVIAEHGREVSAVLEPGALEARHVRVLKPEWWTHYPPKRADELAACLAAARVNRLADDADIRTPWERGADSELIDYELAMIRRSAANMRALPHFST